MLDRASIAADALLSFIAKAEGLRDPEKGELLHHLATFRHEVDDDEGRLLDAAVAFVRGLLPDGHVDRY